MSWYNRKVNKEPKDDNQKAYRDFFGIEDKFLIFYTLNEEHTNGYIVFIDYENDIDWAENKFLVDWTENEQHQFMDCVSKLTVAEAVPVLNLSEKEVMAFKRKLGAIYVRLFNKKFDNVDEQIEEALLFVKRQNTESARKHLLLSSSMIVLICTVVALYTAHTNIQNQCQWFYYVLMGIYGAFVSISLRYGKQLFTGQSNIALLWMEAASRMFIGAAFAMIAVLAIRSGLIMSSFNNGVVTDITRIVCFLSGFNERFIPSLMERLSNKEIEENE